MKESKIMKQARESSTKTNGGKLDYVAYIKYDDIYGANGYSETFVRVTKGHKEPDGIPSSRIIEKVYYRNGEKVENVA